MTDTMIYSTMTEKVAAYDAFFRSSDVFLIVIGVDSDAVGKSEALRALERHPSYMLMLSEGPVVIEQKGYLNDELDYKQRVIYHLGMGDIILADLLAEKYRARILRFARG